MQSFQDGLEAAFKPIWWPTARAPRSEMTSSSNAGSRTESTIFWTDEMHATMARQLLCSISPCAGVSDTEEAEARVQEVAALLARVDPAALGLVLRTCCERGLGGVVKPGRVFLELVRADCHRWFPVLVEQELKSLEAAAQERLLELLAGLPMELQSIFMMDVYPEFECLLGITTRGGYRLRPDEVAEAKAFLGDRGEPLEFAVLFRRLPIPAENCD